ncbi:hypothetical protein HZI58_09225 [Pediococcus acidilactici]|uniref:hypothetical protein n=1 Tax=Pediococcus acidilactici TaxID=1254 RepID=UPI001FCC9CC2|nr:hypothetical protein [Pediococcus acidilactici]MCJ2387265.1 hypothetical protein [Pediococcus acidilactici]
MLIRKLTLAVICLIPSIVLIAIFLLTSKHIPYAMDTIVLGILAYSCMLNAVYLASKPKWIDRLIGLQNGYIFHIFLGSSAIILALGHKLVSTAHGVTQITGYAGLIILVLIAVFSMPLLNGYLKASVAAVRKLNQKVAKFLPHEGIVNVHRLNLLVVLIAFTHVSSMTFFRSNLLFYSLFVVYTLGAVGSFIFNKVREKRLLFTGT